MDRMPQFDVERFSRQTRFTPLGSAGQERLAAARIVIVGCGALGGAAALALVRAGVGHVRLIDRDVPEVSNLPRQVLFDEADVAAGLPKAVAAARHLERMNSAARIEPVVADLTAANVADLLTGHDLVVDGTDNFEARFLVNELCCRERIPWVHGGAIGAEGRVLAVVPGASACLRCLVPEPPAPGSLPTCETAGVLGPAVLVVGAVQAMEAIRLLVGGPAAGNRLLVCDLWDQAWRTVDLAPLAAAGCPTCRGGDYPWLEGRIGSRPAVLCGRDAVQVAAAGGRVDLAVVAERLAAVAPVTANPWIVRAQVEPGIELAVFADGRALVSGTREEVRARAIVARYLGA
jgi:adenylyltransferase/sulfurtransferase